MDNADRETLIEKHPKRESGGKIEQEGRIDHWSYLNRILVNYFYGEAQRYRFCAFLFDFSGRSAAW